MQGVRGAWAAWLGQLDGAAASPCLSALLAAQGWEDPHQIPRASGQSRAIPAAVRRGDTGLSKRK